MIKVTDQFLAHYDPGLGGLSRAGIWWGNYAALGLMGFLIPQDQGEEEIAGVALFRGTYAGDIDYTAPVGMALGKATQVNTFDSIAHLADTWYRYDLRPFNSAGVVGGAHGEPIMLRSDASGGIIDPAVPNPPSYISTQPVAAGKALVVVGYAPAGQAGSPVDLIDSRSAATSTR